MKIVQSYKLQVASYDLMQGKLTLTRDMVAVFYQRLADSVPYGSVPPFEDDEMMAKVKTGKMPVLRKEAA